MNLTLKGLLPVVVTGVTWVTWTMVLAMASPEAQTTGSQHAASATPTQAAAAAPALLAQYGIK